MPWLPLRELGGGGVVDLGLRDALFSAHRLSGFVVEVPTQVPALLRQVLLPVVIDALGSPAGQAEWGERFRRGEFSGEERKRLGDYLDEYRRRFDLFDAGTPFAQSPRLQQSNKETKGAALLVPTMATGNNVPLFSSRTEGDVLELTPAEAARWLLHAQCWDTAAIKSGADGDPAVRNNKTTGNPTGPLGQLGVVVPLGRTLYETLLLNIPIAASQMSLGTPRWQREPDGPGWEARAAEGLLDLWTWQARRVRLIPEDTPRGVRVTRVVLCAGDRLSDIPEYEPHTAWRFVPDRKSGTGTGWRPARHQPGKAVWRGLEALLALEGRFAPSDGKFESSTLLRQLAGLENRDVVPDDYPLRLATYGLAYGNQSAVIEDLIHDTIPLPVASLAADSEVYGLLLEVTDQAEQVAIAVNRLSDTVRRAAGLDPIPWDKGHRPGERLLHVLDPYVRRFLAGVQRAGGDEELIERGQLAWEQTAMTRAHQAADAVLLAAPPQAFAGREVELPGARGRKTLLSLGTAEDGFRRRLRAVLPRAADAANPRLATRTGGEEDRG
ncbi:type I-E CRISPR-associated protein Cse1/CasA [Streptomyces sp. URMC 129]|uniref:type I-E CRISPR-associated protein Cse1/CasA n=1 Tax=Streptomyces sp. URMC 129 TaxID=3423407 RepID=UPI003F1B932C